MSLDDKSVKPHEQLANALAQDLEATDALIAQRMASENAPRIPEVTAHLVGAGGKRLRPMLTIAAARICGYEGTLHHNLAAAVEFIHTATLLHDDVVDESKQRRGRPTANLLWDNKSSVLVGDYLFARSFQLMTDTQNLRVLSILSNASAVITEGEVLQLSAAEDLGTTEDTYYKVVRGKTAALFSASAEAGAVLAGASEDQITALHNYGESLGIAFQVVDDLLDYLSDAETMGKNVGDDFRERKLTLPVIKTIAKAEGDERAFWIRVIDKGDQREGDLEHALGLMQAHGTLEETRQAAIDWADRGRAQLKSLPESDLRDMLDALADYVVARLR
ncbi:farnesyltranstransferase [Thioclava dalianensis]|uniref:Octaprenyl diphosphate synthase n=1 Tax=Thioclava dalianensis TaxID=1185766 RepID=A0A074THV5_9RHOB|nr:polyprenyl synthetase family protein [Thioclava dalianensis]KEP71261.1 farnesyltranstransferase [Thioclava dalianensis]SFM75737.1 octaprenyl-diphosphate synthase [Thioclava dalianensis]